MKDGNRWTDSGADSAVDSKLYSLSHIKKRIKRDKPVSDLALASRIVYSFVDGKDPNNLKWS